MESEKQHNDNERTIVVRAVYQGDTPELGERRAPFFLGGIPIVEAINKKNASQKIISQGRLFPNIEILQGCKSYDPENERVGISEGTVLVLYDVPMVKAERLVGIKNWRFERLSWSKYREIVNGQYDRVNRTRDKLADKLTTGWSRFYGLQIDQDVPMVVRFDMWLGKHERDREFSTTTREHYHVNLRAAKPADIFQAIEYIEQGFFSIGVEVEVAISINTAEVYKTPEGLTRSDNDENDKGKE